MIKQLTFFLGILFLLTIVSCVPSKPKGAEVQCGSGEEFNSKTRTCDSSKGTVQEVSVLEDGTEDVLLNYKKYLSTVATSCEIVSNSITDTTLFQISKCYCVAGDCYARISGLTDSFGIGQFQYKVTDTLGDYDPLSVRVNVISVNDIPTTQAISMGTYDDGSYNSTYGISGSLTSYVDDVEDSFLELTYNKIQDPIPVGGSSAVGSVTITSLTGGFVFTPDDNYYTTVPENHDPYTVIFKYSVTDSDGASAVSSGDVSFVIEPYDDPPVNDSSTTQANITILESMPTGATSFTLYFSDVENDQATACTVTKRDEVNVSSCACASNICTFNIDSLDDSNFNSTSTTATAMFSYTVTTTFTNSAGTYDKTSTSSDVIVRVDEVNDAPSIGAPTSVTGSGAILNSILPSVTITGQEDSELRINGIKLAPGNLSDSLEYGQSFDIAISSSDDSILPDSNIAIEFIGSGISGTATSGNTYHVDSSDFGTSGVMNIILTPDTEQSTTSPINIIIAVTDSIGTSNAYDKDKTTVNYQLSITDIDDLPVITLDSSLSASGVEANEGGDVVISGITIDEGGDEVEDTQTVSFKLQGDNDSLLPIANIEAYYDLDNDKVPDSEERINLNNDIGVLEIGNPLLNSSLHKLILKAFPVAGIYGDVKITISASTDATPATTFDSSTEKYFTLTVNPIGARHGGWKNILAVSPKTDRNNNVINKLKCDYSKSKCDSGNDCVGSASPVGTVVSDVYNAVYYDSTNNLCYVNESNNSSGWQEMENIACNISSSDDVTDCLGSKKIVLEGPSDINIGNCIEYNLYSKEINDNTFKVFEDTAITLSPNNVFYSESTCSGSINQTVIKTGESSEKIYYKDSSASTSSITLTAGVASPVFSAGVFTITSVSSAVDKLVISGPGEISPEKCTAYTVSAVDNNDLAISVTSPVTVSVTLIGSGAVYVDSSCSTATTSFTIGSGDSSASFYLKDTTNSTTGNLAASATGYTSSSFSYETNEVSSASCIGDNTPSTLKILPREDKNSSYFYDKTNKECFYAEPDGDGSSWNQYNVTTDVTLEWDSFAMDGVGDFAGVSVSGWNVYRRVTNQDYDYNNPLNSTIISSSTKKFTDDTAVDSRVYYYQVRPIDSKRSLPTPTREVISEVRIISPPPNMSFVHRWIANKEVCSLMGMDTSSSLPYKSYLEKNYRCPYSGPGEFKTSSGGTSYENSSGETFYDLGSDLLVDQVELGCNYTLAPECTVNGCIGAGAPDVKVGIPASDDLVYYDRSKAKCYYSDSNNWVEIDSMPAITNTFKQNVLDSANKSLLPPLTNISQSKAYDYCAARSNVSISGISPSALNFKLPTRKEQIAYSAWDTEAYTDSDIHTLEQGLQLNSSSKCNSYSASGLHDEQNQTFGYDNSESPNATNLYSIPATANSGIRSIYTGSILNGAYELTEDCKSRYGIQDVVGNVKEWVSDQFMCVGEDSTTADCENDGSDSDYCDYTCTALTGKNDLSHTGGTYTFGVNRLDSNNHDMSVSNDTIYFRNYSLDGVVGPCRDSNSDFYCDAFLTSWTLDTKPYYAERYIFPMGLPMNLQYPSDYSFSRLSENNGSSYLFLPLISTITDSLHDDKVNINSEAIYYDTEKRGGMATGGSYLDQEGAGRYSFDLVPVNDGSSQPASFKFKNNTFFRIRNSSILTSYVGYVVGLDADTSFTFTINRGGVGDEITVTESGGVIDIVVDVDTAKTMQDFVDAINNNSGANLLVSAALDADVLATQTIGSFISLDYGDSYDMIVEANGSGVDGNNIQVELTGGGDVTNETVSISGNVITVNIENGISTNADIATALASDPGAAALVNVYALDGAGAKQNVSGAFGTTPNLIMSPQNLSGGLDAEQNRDPEIGFRCLITIPAGTSYWSDSYHKYDYNYSTD